MNNEKVLTIKNYFLKYKRCNELMKLYNTATSNVKFIQEVTSVTQFSYMYSVDSYNRSM